MGVTQFFEHYLGFQLKTAAVSDIGKRIRYWVSQAVPVCLL